jgi:(S)-mandelate dehydrogenase
MSRLSAACNIADLRLMAKRRLPQAIFDFFDGGAEDEITLRENRAAFERIRLLPKVLVNVAKVDTGTELFGIRTGLPLLIAPTGAVGIGRPGAEVALARAAKAFDIPFTLATPATASIERVAKEAGGRLWFQLYVLKNREVRERLIERARAADYEALVVTVDLPVGGKRERDVRNAFSAPFRASWRNSHDMWRKPAWLLDIARNGIPKMENLEGLIQYSNKTSDVAASVGRELDASFDWDGLARIREAWPRRLIVKGVERTDDAERIAAMGCDGIVVSNHGGRQLDGAMPTIEALPAIAAAVGKRITVLVDGGVRRGVDVVKARALGAQAVQVGRATLFGVMAGGEAGATRALEILSGELVRAMQLCGTRNTMEITADLVQRPAK